MRVQLREDKLWGVAETAGVTTSFQYTYQRIALRHIQRELCQTHTSHAIRKIYASILWPLGECKNIEKIIQKFGLSRTGMYHLGSRKTWMSWMSHLWPPEVMCKNQCACMYAHFSLLVRGVSSRFCLVLKGVWPPKRRRIKATELDYHYPNSVSWDWMDHAMWFSCDQVSWETLFNVSYLLEIHKTLSR